MTGAPSRPRLCCVFLGLCASSVAAERKGVRGTVGPAEAGRDAGREAVGIVYVIVGDALRGPFLRAQFPLGSIEFRSVTGCNDELCVSIDEIRPPPTAGRAGVG